jgi:small subunit ribosomal protein S6
LAIAVNKQYELVLMLDPDVPDERRDEIAAQTRQRIEAGGTLKHDASWGMRKLAYEIRQRTEADYRLFRFEGQSGVLDELNHNLRIADGVLRFRIFKVDPDSPTIVPPPAMGTSGAPTRAPRRDGAPAEAAAEAPSEEPAPAADATEAAEPAPEAAEEPEAPPAPESGQEPAS